MINRREAILSLVSLVSGGNSPDRLDCDTHTALAQMNVAASYAEVRTRGYSSAGDDGGAIYKRVASEPSHPGKVRSLDGTWWEIVPQTLTPQMFGASPAASAAENTVGFQAMSAVVEAWGGGRIIIEGGEFTVFSETINPSPSMDAPYYQATDGLINLHQCDGVVIEFLGKASLKAASGLHFGSFHPLTGKAYEHGSHFTDKNFAATMGDFINIVECLNVRIINPVIHGNNSSYVVGGRWGDTGIQLRASGISTNQSVNVVIEGFDIQYCGLDGIYISGTENQRINVEVRNGTALYNGRQGCSWTGGWGVRFEKCDFAKTGYGGIASPPCAGLDIEHNLQGLGDGHFIKCRFYDNVGLGLLNPRKTSSGPVVFEKCVFQNKKDKRAIWYEEQENGAVFNNCEIYGNIVNVQKCEFNNCYLTNGRWQNGERGSGLFIDVNSAAKFNSCTIECFDNTTYNFNIRGGAEMRRCRFVFSQAIAVARCKMGILGCLVEDCTFTQNFGDAAAAEAAGERCFVAKSSDGFDARGKNRMTGTAIAWNSRTGSQKVVPN